MNSNIVCLIAGIAAGFLVLGVFAVTKYSRSDAAATFDTVLGQTATFTGLAIGAAIVALVFAFVSGKLTV